MREEPLFIGPAELGEIRRQADWREVFLALGIERVKRPGNEHDWWALSPFRTETRPSFHMNAHGFHCFSTGQGGGVIELVQRVKEINCYEAGRWLLENGLSHFCGAEKAAAGLAAQGGEARGEAAEKVPVSGTDGGAASDKPGNRAIRQDLLPLLDAAHPELIRRGISPATAAYLGCGFLPEGGRSPLAGRLVFQVRGVRPGKDGKAAPAILTHIGRALSEEQEAAAGKWHFYGGFRKTQELYNPAAINAAITAPITGLRQGFVRQARGSLAGAASRTKPREFGAQSGEGSHGTVRGRVATDPRAARELGRHPLRLLPPGGHPRRHRGARAPAAAGARSPRPG